LVLYGFFAGPRDVTSGHARWTLWSPIFGQVESAHGQKRA